MMETEFLPEMFVKFNKKASLCHSSRLKSRFLYKLITTEKDTNYEKERERERRKYNLQIQ